MTDDMERDVDKLIEQETVASEESRLAEARAEHRRCIERWNELRGDDRRMTTFHGLDAHLT